MTLPEPLRRAYNWVKRILAEYAEDHGNIVAAAISFYAFISLIPLILVAVSVVGYMLGSPERGEDIVFRNVRQTLPRPTADAVARLVGEIVAGRTPAGIIGLVGLLWSGTAIFVNLSVALNMAWNSSRVRSFLKERALALGMLFVVGLLLLLSFALTTAGNAIQHREIFGFDLRRIPFVWQLFAYLLPPVLSTVMFTIVYKVLPTARVPLKAAFVGGVTAAVLFEILKFAFTFYLTHFANFGAVYGSLGAIIALILWIFYSSVMAVLGAEVSQVYARTALGVRRSHQ